MSALLAHEVWPAVTSREQVPQPAARDKTARPLSLVSQATGASSQATTVGVAIDLLRQRGFVYIGQDPVGLPCYRSPSGALLIGIGSCRSLAYAPVDGRLQVIAAARTSALVCRITLPAEPAR